MCAIFIFLNDPIFEKQKICGECAEEKSQREGERKREKDRENEQKELHQWTIQLFSRNGESNIKCKSVKKKEVEEKARLVAVDE